MNAGSVHTATGLQALLSDFSLEMTGNDINHLIDAAPGIPFGTRVNITFLEHEDLGARIAAARAVLANNLIPIPHVSARRIESAEMLEEFLAALQTSSASEEVFAVGGDPSTPLGPFEEALALIETGLLQDYGVRRVSIAGYPEGHPYISYTQLWSVLDRKVAAIKSEGIIGSIITQFGFDVDPVIDWIEQVRARGIDMPIRVGVPGPAGIRRLVRYAARFGVGTSAGIAKKYGFSITNLMGTAGPDKFISELAGRYRPELHGEVKLHFYTFGGIRATSEWIAAFCNESSSATA